MKSIKHEFKAVIYMTFRARRRDATGSERATKYVRCYQLHRANNKALVISADAPGATNGTNSRTISQIELA